MENYLKYNINMYISIVRYDYLLTEANAILPFFLAALTPK